ncbi:protein phosphatase 1 regulatory subunit 11 [Sarcoptes scabiei]|nr:protein phosphatase 1 regulatory subunit 11 [Sarcoptes scabiei]
MDSSRGSDSRRSSQFSTTTTNVKNKWIKAFRSLKLTAVGGGNRISGSQLDVYTVRYILDSRDKKDCKNFHQSNQTSKLNLFDSRMSIFQEKNEIAREKRNPKLFDLIIFKG